MIKQRGAISKATIGRMAIYYNTLKQMKDEGVEVFVSRALGRRVGIPSAVIRRDLAEFGEFGTQGVGYDVKYLLWRIEKIMGYHSVWKTVVVGVGLPILAINQYYSFLPPGIRILAVLDLDERNLGQPLPELDLCVEPLERLEELVRDREIRIGIIIVSPAQAQMVADRLVQAGVEGIANFSPVPVSVPETVSLTQVNMGSWLSHLTFDLSQTATENYLLEFIGTRWIKESLTCE
ncbi:MAG TPA: redox-sensing transcriptional repressor Rex [Patescibacteria group bacterium]|nr:redox-sensing transcriptional repressor Rex [Patescibacteria group bacterium]